MTKSDFKQLQSMILWLRKERISYVTLTALGVTLDGVQDLKMVEQAKPEKDEPRPSMFDRFAGDLARRSSSKPSDSVPEEALDD